MKYLFPVVVLLAASTSILIAANDTKSDEKSHDHDSEEKSHEHGGKDEEAGKDHEHDGEEEKVHEEGDEHGHEEEAPRFGPNKGVTEANEKMGFKLNEHAYNNFKIELLNLAGANTWQVPETAIVYSREETHVYRFKDGFFKSLDIKIQGKANEIVTISSRDLKPGDKIAAKGTGFLMIVDQAVFGEELAHEH